jgi:hypothetical protein
VGKPDLVTQAFALLARFVDDEPCWFDHGGFCQAHGCEPPCRNQAVRDLLDACASAEIKPVVEHAQRYSGGEWLVWPASEEIERIYPLPLRIEHGQRHGGVVGRRTVIVLKDWKRVPKRKKAGD